MLRSNRTIHGSWMNEVRLSAGVPDDNVWLTQLYLKCDGCFFSWRCSSLVFLAMSEREVKTEFILISPASPDTRNAHSRWHCFGVCAQHATSPFISCELKFTTYPLTGGVNISNMTQAVIFLNKQNKNLPQPIRSLTIQKKTTQKVCFFSFLDIRQVRSPWNIFFFSKFQNSVWDYWKVRGVRRTELT